MSTYQQSIWWEERQLSRASRKECLKKDVTPVGLILITIKIVLSLPHLSLEPRLNMLRNSLRFNIKQIWKTWIPNIELWLQSNLMSHMSNSNYLLLPKTRPVSNLNLVIVPSTPDLWRSLVKLKKLAAFPKNLVLQECLWTPSTKPQEVDTPRMLWAKNLLSKLCD
jgi:hypothetical protein